MKTLFLLLFTTTIIFANAQTPHPPPIFIIDSVKVNQEALKSYNPNDIADVTVFKDTNATRLIGDEGKNGLVIIETKAFVRKRYWSLLCSRSPEYAKIVSSPDVDSTVQYILNDTPVVRVREGALYFLNQQNLKKVTILDKQTL